MLPLHPAALEWWDTLPPERQAEARERTDARIIKHAAWMWAGIAQPAMVLSTALGRRGGQTWRTVQPQESGNADRERTEGRMDIGIEDILDCLNARWVSEGCSVSTAGRRHGS